jgi:threonylcarbamoyladenosine tRNA methylthiotransferase CDKAL1
MRVCIETYGCAMNQGDSEVMSGLLRLHGHLVVPAGGDVIVVNTCTVKTPTENKIRRRLKELQEEGRRVVVAGCMPAADKKLAEKFPKFSFIGVNSGDIVLAVEASAQERRFISIKAPEEKVCLPKIRLNPLVEITPISEGCLGACTYCITRYARGRLKSFPPGRILEQIREAVADGVKEVWLTSQDTGAYGLDIGSNLPELLNKVSDIPFDFKVRVGMMNPNHARSFLDELVETYRNEKIYRFIHLPVQSGSDRILKDMQRGYTAGEFKNIANRFRKELNATISTDVIVGYPGETEEDFRKTLSLVEEIRPDILNISRYWQRPGTKAAEMKQHPGSITKQRSQMTNELFKKIGLSQNNAWIGWEGNALVSERNPDGSYTARNQYYKPIIVKSKTDLFGKSITVKVAKATYYDLRGNVEALIG